MKSLMLKALRISDLLAGIFGFALMVAYWPGIAGAATTPRWDIAALLAVALFFAPPVRMTTAHWLGLVLIGWMALSLLWNDGGSDGRYDGVQELIQLVVIGIAFAVGSTMTDTRALFWGAAIGIGVNSVFAVAQWSGWGGHLIDVLDGNPAGLFFNRDRLAAAAALVALGLVALPRGWLALPLIAPSLILAPSRGAWLALVAGWFVLASARVRWMIGIAGAVTIAWVTLRGFDSSASQRVMIWQDTIANLNFFGHGLGSFREDFIRFAHAFNITAQDSRPENAHNEFLWLDFEGGIPAVGLGVLFALAIWFAGDGRADRAVLAGMFVLCLVAMPLHDPATVVLVAVVAGNIAGAGARLRHGAVDRGLAIRAGLAAGSAPARAI